jgi:hypothetical protein
MLLGLSAWEWSEWGGEYQLLLAEKFGTLFLIGLLPNLPSGDVTRQAKTSSRNQEKISRKSRLLTQAISGCFFKQLLH